ncbi:MAG TPA: hypothetical protein VGG38_07180 [Acidimicrobiales bacterium]|jgi:hypothetical protein
MNSERKARVAIRFGIGTISILTILEVLVPGLAFATGSIGIGIQAEPIALATPVTAGHQYNFPTAYIVNKGTEGVVAKFEVRRFNGGIGHDIPAAWIEFPTPYVLLRPGQSVHILIILNLPKSAVLGKYQSDVFVDTATKPNASRVGAQVGAAAATKIEFTVGSHPAPSPSRKSIPLAAYIGGGVLLLVLLLLTLWRLGFRVRVDKAT